MTLYNRICIALCGITAGIVVIFAADMVLNGGRFVAHTVHAKHPDCSGTCHGPTEQISAPRPSTGMALPNLQSANRPVDSPARPRRYPLLGVQMETGRGY